MTVSRRSALIAPALLLTAILSPAQNNGLEPTLEVELDDQTLVLKVTDDREFFAGILAAPKAELLPGVGILRNAFIAASGPSVNGRYRLKVPYTDALGEFYVQAVTIAEGPRWGLSSVVHVGPKLSGDAEGEANEELGEASRIECNLLIADSNPELYYVQADFEARSDGYELLLSGVERHDQTVDVFVFLKKYGEGEGMLDVVEFHELLVPLGSLPGVTTVRVLVAEDHGQFEDPGSLRGDYEFWLKDQFRIRP